MFLDVNATFSGEIINKFADYSYERKRDHIKKVFIFREGVTAIISQYPESTKCMGK